MVAEENFSAVSLRKSNSSFTYFEIPPHTLLFTQEEKIYIFRINCDEIDVASIRNYIPWGIAMTCFTLHNFKYADFKASFIIMIALKYSQHTWISLKILLSDSFQTTKEAYMMLSCVDWECFFKSHSFYYAFSWWLFLHKFENKLSFFKFFYSTCLLNSFWLNTLPE